MVRIPVCLNDMTDAKHLVQIAEGCEKDVDLMCGKYLVDAKSFITQAEFRQLWKRLRNICILM